MVFTFKTNGMKILIFASLFSIAACTNSPEGSTNTEGSGSSIFPEKSGDTSRDGTDNGSNRGLISTDSIKNSPVNSQYDSGMLTKSDSAMVKVYLKNGREDSGQAKKQKKKDD